MPARIGPKRPFRLYLAEWRERREYYLTQKALGERLGVSDVTVSRWETGERRPDLDALAALAEALPGNVTLTDLYRHPDTQSIDALMRGADDDLQKKAYEMVKILRTGT